MQNKSDKILAEQPAKMLPSNSLPPNDIVVGLVPSHSQSPLSIIEIFKKRLDNWSPAEVSPFGIKYQLSQLFNEHLTVKDLKNNIHNFKDMADVMTHYKMSLDNRYLLLNALIAVFPPSAHNNKIPEPYCDDQFIALLVKNDDDFKKLLHLIREYPHSHLVSKFLEWATIKSLYLQDFISKYHAMATAAPMRMQIPSNSRPELHTYIRRIAAIKKKDLFSFTVFQDILFDKEFTAVKLKENIHNLEDLLTIFREGSLPPKACYSLFNYLISKFPVPNNNGNLRAHPCDELFLKKIITSEADLKIIYGFISTYKSKNLVETIEKRLSSTFYCRDLIRGKITSQQSINHSNCFFSSNTQPLSQIRSNTQKATVLIDLVSSEEEPPLEKDTMKSHKDRRESEITDPRSPKRLKENTEETSLKNGVAQSTAQGNPLGELNRFFVPEPPSIILPESPQGGEYEYEIDANGKLVPIS